MPRHAVTNSHGSARRRSRVLSPVAPVTHETIESIHDGLLGRLKASHVREARAAGKIATEAGLYRDDTLAWLSGNLQILGVAVENVFASTTAKAGPDTGYIVEAGSLLGANIVKNAIEDGAVALKECQYNLATWGELPHPGIVYYPGKDIEEELIRQMFAPDTAEALGDIAHPAARTGAIVVIGVAMRHARDAVDFASHNPA